MTIKDLQAGASAGIVSVGNAGQTRQHLLDMGLIPGATVKVVKRAPLGDPIEITLHGYSLSLRKEEAGSIEVTGVSPAYETNGEAPAAAGEDFPYNDALHEHNAHPGLGEAGKYHSKDHENPLPKDTVLTFALAAQQNCGKTTLFNRLTGSNQHVGNFPGVTVDRKDGRIQGHPDTVVTDLPGIYSLSAYTAEELVARHFILEEQPKAIINILDANNIERNLYLTVQLMELDVPMVVALNMMDEVRGNGGQVRVNEMERLLGVPVVPIAAARGEGLEELVEHAGHIARFQEKPARHDFCSKDDYGGAVHRCLHAIMHFVEDHAARAGLPVRFVASRLVEGDEEIISRLALTGEELDALEKMIASMEQELGQDRHVAMAGMRFKFIEKLCDATVVKPRESKEQKRSVAIDKILTGKWTAVPCFLAIICLTIWLSVDVVGAWLQDLLDAGIGALAGLVDSAFVRWEVAGPVRSLVVDAVFSGVGSVLSFTPVIIILFFFLSLLEDSGYMARIAFVSDRLLSRIGLSGRSIVPLLIGFGCSVPAVMATRTLPSARDRKLTVLNIPFMSCSAKIPIFAFLTDSFFPGHGGLMLAGLYLCSILLGLLMDVAIKLFGRRRDASPFVMELPVYRLPRLRNVGHLLWDKTKDFVQRAFTVIFMATLVIWFLQSFNFRLEFVEADESMLAAVSGAVAPVFQPAGLGDWRIVTALITGFLAKESVVSTMEVLGVTGMLCPAAAAALLFFCLIYTPCVAAIASVKRELGWGWALWIIVYQCLLAWGIATLAYQILI